jgi:hypothetical protein
MLPGAESHSFCDCFAATGAIFGDAGTSIFKSNTVFNFSLAVSGCGGSFPPQVGTR